MVGTEVCLSGERQIEELVIAKIGNRVIEKLTTRKVFNYQITNFGNYQSHSNHPVRYVSHQLSTTKGSIATIPHIRGRTKSAARHSTVKISQNIFFCIRSSPGGKGGRPWNDCADFPQSVSI